MGLAEELRDPRGVLVAALVGGIAWAVEVPAAAAAGTGAAVLGVKAVTGWLLDRGKSLPARPLPVRNQSLEQEWLRRAELAVRSFQKLAGSAPAGPVADKCRVIGEQAGTTLEAMGGLAGQVSAVGAALGHVDVLRLATEEARLAVELEAAEGAEVGVELARSRESIQSQLAVHRRLEQAGRMLLARMESGALDLEGLVARLAEILALAEGAVSPVEGAGQIDALVDELEGLRSGLLETEDVSRRALSAFRAAG